MTYLHERIRAVRDGKNMSQQTLAELSGVPRSRLQQLEGGGNVTRETMEKAIAPLGLHLVVLTTEELQALRTLAAMTQMLPPVQESAAGYIRPELHEKIRQLDQLIDGKG